MSGGPTPEVKATTACAVVNNHLLIDRINDQPETTYQGEIHLPRATCR